MREGGDQVSLASSVYLPHGDLDEVQAPKGTFLEGGQTSESVNGNHQTPPRKIQRSFRVFVAE